MSESPARSRLALVLAVLCVVAAPTGVTVVDGLVDAEAGDRAPARASGASTAAGTGVDAVAAVDATGPLELVSRAEPKTVTAGETVTITLELRNEGDADYDRVFLELEKRSDWTIEEYSADGGRFVPGDEAVGWEWSSLPAGERLTVTVTLRTADDAAGEVQLRSVGEAETGGKGGKGGKADQETKRGTARAETAVVITVERPDDATTTTESATTTTTETKEPIGGTETTTATTTTTTTTTTTEPTRTTTTTTTTPSTTTTTTATRTTTATTTTSTATTTPTATPTTTRTATPTPTTTPASDTTGTSETTTDGAPSGGTTTAADTSTTAGGTVPPDERPPPPVRESAIGVGLAVAGGLLLVGRR